VTPERWRQIEDTFQAAFEHTSADRAAFLDSACASDADLRSEVEALLTSADHVRGFLESNALEDAAVLLVDEPPGMHVGPYAVEEPLGSGGMGDVFLARDIRLGRRVALKLLDPARNIDNAARARFLREARLASSLEHPNICTVYDVGESDGRLFIAMQYVEGKTLRDIIGGRPLNRDTLLPIALRVADALAAAHDRGIVHRDVKSCNIIVTPQRQAKVLDFGLATLVEHGPRRPDPHQTAEGIVIGTPSSMSPEQATGGEVDHRSDIFSFGVVLYEMATGHMPFEGRTRADVIRAILTRPHLPAGKRHGGVPDRLSRAIDKALAKEPRDRYQSMAELIKELRALDADASRTVLSKRRLAVGALFAALIILPLANLATRPASMNAPVTAPAESIRSIAVLPFKPLVAGQRNEALEMGMADSLIAKLSAIRQIDIRPISAVRKYGSLEQDPLAAGREQRVDAVMDGQIQTAGERVRVTVRLLSVESGRQLWTEQFDERLTDIFSLQDSVSGRVLRALAVTLSGDEKSQLTKRHTNDVEAYELYMLGRYHLTRLVDDGFWKALQYFQQAAAKDPRFALAHAGISDAYFNLSSFNAIAPREGFPKAREAAETALGLDAGLAEAHAALAGAIFLHDWNWTAAEAEYRLALELNPGASDAHMAYGFFLAAMGRSAEALRETERALELDPISPVKITGVGDVLLLSRRYGEAEAQYRKALAMNPDFGYALWALGRALSGARKYAEAVATIEKAILRSGDSPDETAELARAYALAGRSTEARQILGRLSRVAERRYVAPATFAAIHAALDDKTRAFAWLERARAERDFLLVMLRADPMFDTLRDDPRFAPLLEQLAFPRATAQ
jgi:serine/threonine-protein kinase